MQPGSRIAHYEVLSALGRGGMGEVWKASDTKLRREVALKTLPPEFATDLDRLARLEREATALAALNHPNVASIYGIEEHLGARFLVLELVDGDTLEERLHAGPLPVGEALKIAAQIADALEAAHEKGVVHRDLKPANVKITPDGRVKVLDFGLAKNLSPAPSGKATETALRTEIGAIMGTPPYMSPEQARGDAVGRQTDLWSLGVMLYEMLTGRLPFPGDTTTDTLVRVLDAAPDFSRLPKETPLSVQHLLRRCLEKDRKRRFQHAGDLRIELEDALAAPPEEPPAAKTGRLPLAAAALVAAALGALAFWFVAGRPTPEAPADATRLSMSFLGPPADTPFGSRHLAIASDGSYAAFAAANQLWIRRLREQNAVAVDEVFVANPFFSPDGEWLGFFSHNLMKVPSSGGTPTIVARDADRAAGATWGADGTIVYATPEGLFRVAAGGGEPELIARPDPARKERLYAWPQFLPDGRSFLFTLLHESLTDAPQIVWLDLQTRETRVVVADGTAARYAPTGQLIYATGQTLNAIAFDLEEHVTRGEPVALADIAVRTTTDNGAAEFAFSDTGTLLYLAPLAPNSASAATLEWVDREGAEEPLPLQPGPYIYPRVSPDGTRVLVDVVSANRDAWIWDLRRASFTRLTNGPTEDLMPMWSHDGRRVFFASNRTGNFDVYSQPADGATDARLEVAAPGFQTPEALTPDGTQLIVYENYHDLSVLELGRSELQPLIHNDVEHRLAEVSPDGHWLAYESNESGSQFEIFLRPFPNVEDQREKVSINGGRYPKWGPLGSGELFYVDTEGAMMAAAIELAPALRLGGVTKLFDWTKPPPGNSSRPYDISPLDGRFLVTKPTTTSADQVVTASVVLNWFSEVRAQTRKK